MEDRDSRSTRRGYDEELHRMVVEALSSSSQALDVGNTAVSEIRTHVKECADNYRALTRWVMASLLAALGGMALKMIELIISAAHVVAVSR